MLKVDRNRDSTFGDPFGMQSLKRDIKNLVNPLKEDDEDDSSLDQFFENFFNKKISQQVKMTSDVKSTLKSLESRINIDNSQILTEDYDFDEEIK